MNIMRQKEMVEAFHYDWNNGVEGETEIKVDINPIDMSDQPDFPVGEGTLIGLRVNFKIIFEEFLLSGSVSQLVSIVDTDFAGPESFTQADLDELMAPLFSIIERMTYEVTEIALDRPGVQLNFESQERTDANE